jgi:hypothetical protein
MDEKTLVPESEISAERTFLYREDYLLFGLLVRHGLVEPADHERLAAAQRQHPDQAALLAMLSSTSNLTDLERKNIQELLDLLATPKLREKLPARLPEVDTIIEALPATQVTNLQAQVKTMRAGQGATLSDTEPDTLIGTDGPTLVGDYDTTLTQDEILLLQKSQTKGGLVGQTLSGHVVLDRIGTGGQGDVYLAKQISLNRYVALKKLEVPYRASPQRFLDAFRQEAQTLARINHARIVKVYEIFQRDNEAYFTMEYINGSTLKDLVQESGEALPLDVVANLACQACSALARTAEDGLVHRDIKPANMLIDENGDLKIVDFGLAGAEAQFTEGGAGFVGTPHFASPEQCRSEAVTPVSDQYSLGITLYYALTGSLPFQANKLGELLEQQIEKAPQPPTFLNEHLPKSVDRIIMRMLEKNPAKRFAGFDECFNAWEKVLYDSSQAQMAGSKQLLGESLLRLGRRDRQRLMNQGAILTGLWALMVLGAVLGETGLRRHGMHWFLEAAGLYGTLLLAFSLCCIFYVAAARKNIVPTVGSLRGWLITHIATAVPSVVLILIHSGNFLRNITPGPPAAQPILSIAITTVLLVTAVSGSVGLLIFRELRRNLQLQQMKLRGTAYSPREAMLALLSARFLSGWRLVHYPLAVLFILLTILHIFVSIRYMGE